MFFDHIRVTSSLSPHSTNSLDHNSYDLSNLSSDSISNSFLESSEEEGEAPKEKFCAYCKAKNYDHWNTHNTEYCGHKKREEKKKGEKRKRDDQESKKEKEKKKSKK